MLWRLQGEEEDDDVCVVSNEVEEKAPPVMRHQWMRGSIDDSQVGGSDYSVEFRMPRYTCIDWLGDWMIDRLIE